MYLSATTKTASECPYKECIHRVSLEPPESEPQAADVAEVVPDCPLPWKRSSRVREQTCKKRIDGTRITQEKPKD